MRTPKHGTCASAFILFVIISAAIAIPATATGSVRAMCEPFTGSVLGLAATPLDRGATVTWTPAQGTVRLVRAGYGYCYEPTTGVLPLCWNAEARVVYEGTGSEFIDQSSESTRVMENGYTYYYTAFLVDSVTGTYGAPSGCYVTPQGPAAVSKPVVPSYVADHRTFAVTGSLGFTHWSNTTVRLTFHRKVGGVWKYLKSGLYGVKAGRSWYKIYTALPADGSIRLTATHADADHYRSTSAARFFYSH